MNNLSIDLKTTALVLIDLQKGIVVRASAPRSGQDVVKNAARLADAFRNHAGLVVLVHVEYRDVKERVNVAVDIPFPSSGVALSPDWSEFVPEIGQKQGDIIITKRQWGAFYGTDLDLQLRRRRVKTLVLGGIATNFGVESTARYANERGFEQIFIEDAMASFSVESHRFTIENIFPRIGRVCSTEDILKSI